MPTSYFESSICHLPCVGQQMAAPSSSLPGIYLQLRCISEYAHSTLDDILIALDYS